MHIYERRRIRLSEVLSSMTVTELSKSSGVAASSISSAMKKLPDGRYLRNIGEKTARKLEAGAQKPEGWLDAPDSQDPLYPHQKSSIQLKKISIETAIDALESACANLSNDQRKEASTLLAMFANNPRPSVKQVVIELLSSQSNNSREDSSYFENEIPKSILKKN